MDEASLLEKLRRIEALFAGATTQGEKIAAAEARRRIHRYRGQKRSSIMAKVSRRFVDETLWPEYEQLSRVLQGYLDDITERVIAEVIHKDMSDATEVEAPRGLPQGVDK